MKVPARKDYREKKDQAGDKKTERPRRACSETVLIKLLEGVSYAAILKNRKSRVNPEELGVTIGGIRESRSKDLLDEVKCAVKHKGRLDPL